MNFATPSASGRGQLVEQQHAEPFGRHMLKLLMWKPEQSVILSLGPSYFLLHCSYVCFFFFWGGWVPVKLYLIAKGPTFSQ